MARRCRPRLEDGLEAVGADAELDIIEPDTPLNEFYRLSMNTIGPSAVAAGVVTSEHAEAIAQRLTDPGFLGCGFVYIGVWGRRQSTKEASQC